MCIFCLTKIVVDTLILATEGTDSEPKNIENEEICSLEVIHSPFTIGAFERIGCADQKIS